MEQRIHLTAQKATIDLKAIVDAGMYATEKAYQMLGRQLMRNVLTEFLGKTPTDSDLDKVNMARAVGAHSSFGVAFGAAILGDLVWKVEGTLYTLKFFPNPMLAKIVA